MDCCLISNKQRALANRKLIIASSVSLFNKITISLLEEELIILSTSIDIVVKSIITSEDT